MTDSMVERAALALFNCTHEEWMLKSDHFRGVALKDVRRMIAAMREATEAMEKAGDEWGRFTNGPSAIVVWEAMIDEAMK